MSDRLALAHAFEHAGIPRDKAEEVAAAVARFVEGSAATKGDVERTEAALRATVERTESALKTNIQAVSADLAVASAALKAEVAATRADLSATISRLEHSLTLRGLGALISGLGILFWALHMWPPHAVGG